LIYKVYANENPTAGELNPLNIGRWASNELHFSNLMFIHLLCDKLDRPKPKFIVDYTQHKHNVGQEMADLIESIENYKF
jgi:hypothetical protein